MYRMYTGDEIAHQAGVSRRLKNPLATIWDEIRGEYEEGIITEQGDLNRGFIREVLKGFSLDSAGEADFPEEAKALRSYIRQKIKKAGIPNLDKNQLKLEEIIFGKLKFSFECFLEEV